MHEYKAKRKKKKMYPLGVVSFCLLVLFIRIKIAVHLNDLIKIIEEIIFFFFSDLAFFNM
jgi:hypothetical protein